jgi:hypothetical protein
MTFLLLRIVLQWLRKRACLAPVRETEDGVIFRAEGLKRCYLAFTVISLGVVALIMYMKESPLWTALPLMVAVGCLAAWPADVVLDHRGITQIEWWGRVRHIAWNEVAAMARRARTGDTLVLNVEGEAIRHSGCHAGQLRFQSEVMAHTGITHIADWDAVPSLTAGT